MYIGSSALMESTVLCLTCLELYGCSYFLNGMTLMVVIVIAKAEVN